MVSRELTDLLIQHFDRQGAMSVEHALSEALRAEGIAKGKAEAIACDEGANVLRELSRRRPEELPFRFGKSDPQRLIGKERVTSRDTPETAHAKRVWAAAEPLLNHLTSISPDDFEVVCAACLVLTGGSEARALCTGDEGGIDFYGRLPVRGPDDAVPSGLVYTTLLPKALLVLGQAKRYPCDAKIGRPAIQLFKGQIDDCVKKYEGNQQPPSHRVPESFYDRGEPCLGVFVTTASFAETAESATAASGVHLVDGLRLAQFLVYHRVGVELGATGDRFSREAFSAWLSEKRQQVM